MVAVPKKLCYTCLTLQKYFEETEGAEMFQFNRKEYEKRIAWFQQARFGMFIHFGLYAIPARGEWVRSHENITLEEYQPFFERFHPTRLDVRAWVQAAKDAGMQYIVLTAKHHDGFCLFDSSFTDYKITNTAYGKDLVREYLDAARDAGLKVGLYYSLLDWHHPDYPHYGDRYHPLRDNPKESNENRRWDNYVSYFHRQVRELCSNYGKLDLLWFDFSYDDMRGDVWQAGKLMEMVRSLQPDVVVNNRLEASGEGFGSLYECKPSPWHGDFVTPEKMIPPNGIQDIQGNELCWESCVTMNNSWGYTRDDRCFKPAGLLIKKLVECVSKGGNMILNVGPDAAGEFPPESLDCLKKIGSWMRKNGESIYGCGKAGLDKPDYGRFTRQGNFLYLHIYENALGPLPLPQIREKDIVSVTMLADGSDIPISTSWVHSDYPEICFLDLGSDPILPDETDTVLKIVLREADGNVF